MSWFSRLVDTIAGQRSVDYVITPALKVGTQAPNPQPLPTDACYIDLRVASARIPKSRIFTSNFYGVVHAFTSVVRAGESRTKMATVVAPTDLYDIDPPRAHKVMVVDRRVMGLMPWRGDILDLEIGLFSVKTADLAEPYLKFLSKLADTAGVGFPSAAAPFVPLLKDALELLTGPTGAATLEVGISRSLPGKTGTYAVIGRDKKDFDMSKLSVDPTDHKLLFNNQPLDDVAYLVFEICSADQQPDYGSIPELKSVYDDLKSASKEEDAREALAEIKRKLALSPDLTTADAKRLYQSLKEKIDFAYGAGLTADEGEHLLPETLAGIKLYN